MVDEHKHFCVPDYMLCNHAYPLPPTTSPGSTPWLGQHENSTGDLASSFFKRKMFKGIQQRVNLIWSLGRSYDARYSRVLWGSLREGRAVHRHWVVLYNITALPDMALGLSSSKHTLHNYIFSLQSCMELWYRSIINNFCLFWCLLSTVTCCVIWKL